MDSPELPVASSCKIAPCMHSQNIITDKQISFLPNVVVGNPPVVQNRINSFTNRLALPFTHVLNINEGFFEAGLAAWPGLVVSQTWLSSCGVGDHELHPSDFGIIKRASCDGPGQVGKSYVVENRG